MISADPVAINLTLFEIEFRSDSPIGGALKAAVRPPFGLVSHNFLLIIALAHPSESVLRTKITGIIFKTLLSTHFNTFDLCNQPIIFFLFFSQTNQNIHAQNSPQVFEYKYFMQDE